MRGTHFVFHMSCAALTLICAVSLVNGGKGGFPASWLVKEAIVLICSKIEIVGYDFEENLSLRVGESGRVL